MASVAAICIAGRASAGEVRCPAEIAVDQRVGAAPSGWTVSYNGFKNELATVTIFEGPPEQNASLVPDDQKTGPHTIAQTWKLAPSTSGYWITCGYSNTSAQISQKLSADVSRCEVTLERDVSFSDGRHPVSSAVCRSAK